MPACERQFMRVLAMLGSRPRGREAAINRLARTSVILSYAFGRRKLQHAQPMPDAIIDCAFRDAFGIMRTCFLGSPKFNQALDAMRDRTPARRVIHPSVGKFSDIFGFHISR